MSYSLTVFDLCDGAVLVAPYPRSAWPALPSLGEIRDACPRWLPALPPDASAPKLRLEICLLHDGRSTVRQDWLGYWVEGADGAALTWREADDPQPMRLVISSHLDGFCVWDQHGAGLSLAEDFPPFEEVGALEQELLSWAWAYDQACVQHGSRVSMRCIQTHWRCAMDTAVLTLRVPAEIKQQLDKLADATHRSKSWLAGEAIRQYLDLEAWQIGEIKQALAEADAGDFATDAELAAMATKYVR